MKKLEIAKGAARRSNPFAPIEEAIEAIKAGRFDVQLVPYTLEHTNLGGSAVHDLVNLECDMIGKYVVHAAALAGVTVTRPL